MTALKDTVQSQARDLVGIATGSARTDDRVLVQNTAAAVLRQAKANDGGHTLCGWRFSGARKLGAGPPYRMVPTLANLPASMICELCLPTERALAVSLGEV